MFASCAQRTHHLIYPVSAGDGLSAQSRAQQLAAVAVAVYEAAGSGIHLPLEASNPLLAILKQALDKEEGERSVGQALANALLESVLQAVDTETDSFPALIVSPAVSTSALTEVGPAMIGASVTATYTGTVSAGIACLLPGRCQAMQATPKPNQLDYISGCSALLY